MLEIKRHRAACYRGKLRRNSFGELLRLFKMKTSDGTCRLYEMQTIESTLFLFSQTTESQIASVQISGKAYVHVLLRFVTGRGVFPTGAEGPIILAAVKPDSPTEGRTSARGISLSVSCMRERDGIRGIGEAAARPQLSAGLNTSEGWALSFRVIYSTLTCSLWTRCLGVNAHRTVNTLLHPLHVHKYNVHLQ